jgi:hypothetical protein
MARPSGKRWSTSPAPTNAYLVVLDVDGNVRWVGHGNPDAAGTADLKAQVDSLMRRHLSP